MADLTRLSLEKELDSAPATAAREPEKEQPLATVRAND
jgi:hypothetical protein